MGDGVGYGTGMHHDTEEGGQAGSMGEGATEFVCGVGERLGEERGGGRFVPIPVRNTKNTSKLNLPRLLLEQ